MPRLEAIKNKYQSEGLWSAVKEVPVQGWDLVKENPRKTAATFVSIAAVASLTAAYFLSPVYATFVGASVVKAAALVSPAITAMSTFATAHPLVASLVVLAAVAALITATVYACKNSGKSEEIKALNSNINGVVAKVNDENQSPGTKINETQAVTEGVGTRSV
ncbi:hypothetical protein [Wolbachia endosymbiont of Nilaparvata lugens]|uniref:hypothetical protein n=1 Tax=Wolbachia endosymbiont of Nilaparvata lugens TaxID=357143 RepID=UPI00117BFB40|nr:hypothetical protein [Wolbachia endosymbiont of Nilaparvata lugens]